MAIQLAEQLGGSATTWIQMQANYDLAKARKHQHHIKVEKDAPELVHA